MCIDVMHFIYSNSLIFAYKIILIITREDFNKMALLGQDAVCIITGASKGIGRSIAKAFSQEWADSKSKVDFILLARTVSGLEETRSVILEKFQSSGVAPNVQVHLLPCDLEDLSAVDKTASELVAILDGCKGRKQAVLVHNAGSIGDVSKYGYHLSAQEVSSYFDLNFASFVGLTSSFMSSSFESKTIINITSILAQVPLEGTALYGAGKAAREHYLKVLSKEAPSVRILNYSPGPCDTDQHKCLRDKWVSEQLRKNAREAYDKGEVLDPNVSVEKLVSILKENSFQNASTVDYFDDNKPRGV